MPSLVTDPGIIHYETYGRGRPVLLLHGWLGSWALWRDTIEVLGREFRTYALDFFGFGESGVVQDEGRRGRRDAFTVPTYVEMVYQFMDRLGIQKAPLIGHSMGGTVSLSTAIRYPEKVVKVCVIGSPIDGSSLNLLLKLSGNPTLASVFWLFGGRGLLLFLRGYSYFMAKDGRAMSRMIAQDVSKISVESFFQSICSRSSAMSPALTSLDSGGLDAGALVTELTAELTTATESTAESGPCKAAEPEIAEGGVLAAGRTLAAGGMLVTPAGRSLA